MKKRQRHEKGSASKLHLAAAIPESQNANDRAFEYYHRLREVKRFVEEHSAEEISLRRAARIAGLERKYFSNFFQKKIGLGFKLWLTCKRVGRAMELMKTEDYPISEIAHAAGFRDLRTFERAFKKFTNLTPRQFKNGVRP